MKLLASLLLIGLPAIAADAGVFEIRKADIRALLQTGDFRTALQKAKTLNRDWPDDQAGYQLLAAAQLGLGDYADAEKSEQWMLDLRIGKADAQGWFLIAQLREVSGDIEGAADAVNLAYSRAFPVDQQLSRQLLTYLAHLQLLAGRLAMSDQFLKNVFEMDPDNESATEQLALLRNAQGKRSEAVAILRRLTQRVGAPGFLQPRFQYELAELTGEPRDYQTFEQAARPLIDSAKNFNCQLALYYAGPGKRPVESERIARIEAARRHDVYTLDALATALFSNGKASEAKATMRNILLTGTVDPGIRAHAKRMGVGLE